MGAKHKFDIARISNLKKGIQNLVTSKWQRVQADKKENVPVCISYHINTLKKHHSYF
jgi:hypothetical protein